MRQMPESRQRSEPHQTCYERQAAPAATRPPPAVAGAVAMPEDVYRDEHIDDLLEDLEQALG